MRKTTNYGLVLYDAEDKMNITSSENSLNATMEIIDEALAKKTTIEDMTNYIEAHKDELKGADGKDGYTPVKGKDYFDGQDGKDGVDGYSPTAKVETTSTGATVIITDKNGTTTTTITNGKDGVDGYTPVKGKDYFDGQDGKDGVDGYSPTAKVETTSTGATVIITDKNGTTTTTITNGKDGVDGYTPVKGTDYWTEEDKTEIKGYIEEKIPINNVKNFGAVGDGIADDTEAIQNALDTGGIVYFPTGIYKTTSTLYANTPCTIKMNGVYPSCYPEELYEGYTYPMGDYPTSSDYNHFGARIETYATGYGLVIGESVIVDGLNIRAMEGFTGTILKYDGSKGVRNYPSTTRLEHIRVHNDTANITPDTMFEFFPYGNYGVIVDDVIIGSNHTRQYATYGFKCILDKWVNSIRISNINVEVFANYPFYINGKTPHEGNLLYAANWVLKNICLQAFPKASWDNANYIHTNMLYLEGMTSTYITGCKIWDVEAATVTGDVVKTVDLKNTTSIGNDTFINAIDILLTEKFEKANELNLTNLEVSVATNSDATGNIVTMKDGNNTTKSFTIPSATLTDEQVGTAVGNWMVENGAPVEQIGKNKLNPDTCYDGDINETYGHEQESIYAWVSGYIECAYGDEVRVYETVTIKSTGEKTYRQRTLTAIYEYDVSQGFIGVVKTFTDNIYTPSSDKVAYFRIQFQGKNGNYPIMYEDRGLCMATINNTNSTLEEYKVELVGGIGQYLVLASPDGTKYTLIVDNDGTLSAKAVN